MVKEKKTQNYKKRVFLFFIYFLFLSPFIFLVTVFTLIYKFEKDYQQRIYPGVKIDNLSFGGKTVTDIENYYLKKSLPLKKLKITLTFEDQIATISANDLSVSFDEKLAAKQAFLIGRSGNFFSDLFYKWQAYTIGINLPSVLKIDYENLDDTIANLSQIIDIPAHNALFQFESGKVSIFKASSNGRKLNKPQIKQMITSYVKTLSREENITNFEIIFEIPVDLIIPKITTENSNNYGIKEQIGYGISKFAHSIPTRIHNVELAASRINGHLVPPNSTFSFNDTLGDVSAATGFQPAYIIQNGRTVLGDGGGVCQVSTTLFRAALNTGLPIIERKAHAYRVGYYEQDSPPGIDATVFAPSYDLKFKNDTGNYLLIQSEIDTNNLILEFYIYGTTDGRKSEITKPVISSQSSPPPDLYQDDPTLPKGIIKQVDWSAYGAKVNFDYKVTKEDRVINEQSFFSNYQPWRNIFLRGTKE